MKTLIKTVLILSVTIAFVVASCPDKDAHKTHIRGIVKNAIASSTADKGIIEAGLTKILGRGLVEVLLTTSFSYENKYWYSIGYITIDGEKKPITIGILGIIYTPIDEEDLKEVLNEINPSNSADKKFKPEGTYISKDNPFYKTLKFKGKSTVIIKDNILEMEHSTSYTKEGNLIRIQTDKSDLLLEIKDANTLVGKKPTKGTFKKTATQNNSTK